jgi:hypothetical protein
VAIKAYKAFMWTVTMQGGGATKGGTKTKEVIEREHSIMEETVTRRVPECIGECEFGYNSQGMI